MNQDELRRFNIGNQLSSVLSDLKYKRSDIERDINSNFFIEIKEKHNNEESCVVINNNFIDSRLMRRSIIKMIDYLIIETEKEFEKL